MWRHSKAHVIDEVCIPPLHIHRVMLDFSKVESAHYKLLEYNCQSSVYFEEAKGKLEDRTASQKLDSLRQACAHPQAGAGSFLGAKVLPMQEIGRRLVTRAQDENTVCERDLCRALNRIGCEYRRQGDELSAERAFTESWRIADSGVTVANVKEKPSDASSAPTLASRSSSSGAAPSKSIDVFETDTNIVTQNAQVRSWRVIEISTCFQLSCIYAQQLKREFGHVVEQLGEDMLHETGEHAFQALMANTRLLLPAFLEETAADVTTRATGAVVTMLPPQLAAAAAAVAAAVASAGAAASASSDNGAAPSADGAIGMADVNDTEESEKARVDGEHHR
jgi:hypothetical protein